MHPEPVRGNLYVAGLPHGTSDEQLAELFDAHGVVLRAFVARDPATGELLGHGLVELAPDEAVEEAVAALGAGSGHGAGQMEVRRADPEMSLVAPPRAASRPAPAARPSSPVRSPAPAAAPRFTVERVRTAPRQQLAVPASRPVPADGPACDRPMGRLSLPVRAAGRAAAPPLGGAD